MKKILIAAAFLIAGLAACTKDDPQPEPQPDPGFSIPELDSERLPGGWPAKVVPNLNGAAVHFNVFIDFGSYWNSAAMNQFQRAGYKFVRLGAPWHDVELTKGVYQFSNNPGYTPGYDQAFKAFFNRGMRPIFCVGFGNSLYGQSQTVPINTEEGITAFANYCKAMMKEYRDYDPIFEIWNEPNLDSFGGYTPEDYVQLVSRCKAAILEGWAEGRDTRNLIRPLVIGPVVSGTWGRGNMFDRCLDAGLLNVVDGLSFHPYTDGNANTARRIPEIVGDPVALLRDELVRRGKRRDFPLVFTEWGWCTATAAENNDWWVTYEEQAKLHVRMLLMGYYNAIDINCIYSLDDARNEDQRASEVSKHYGIFETTGDNFYKMLRPKPSVAAVTEFTEALRGYAYVEKVNLGTGNGLNPSEDWCLVFRHPKTGAAKAAVWTTRKNTTKTSPDLKPLMGLRESVVVEFTDMPKYVEIKGYVPK